MLNNSRSIYNRMSTYKGKYTVKNKSKYKGDLGNVTYRSSWEKAAMRWCDANPKVEYWSSEETVIPYYYEYDKKYHKYYIDLKIKYNTGKVVLVEIKPNYQTEPPTGSRRTKKFIREALEYVKNMNKWEAADTYAKDRNWDFQIWTEETLIKMGIIKNRLKPLKKIKKRL